MDTWHSQYTLIISIFLLFLWICGCKAETTLTVARTPVRSLQNNNVTLTCIVTGVSDPEIHWKFPDGIIHGKIVIILIVLT